MVSDNAPIKNCFFIFYSPMGLIGFQSQMFWGSTPQVGPLKFEVKMCRSNSLLLREKLGFGDSLLNIWPCTKGGIYGKNISQSFLPVSIWVLSHSPNVQESLSCFWISLRGNCATCSYTFGVSMGRGKFRSFLCHHLGLVSNVTNLNYLSFPVYLVFNFNFFNNCIGVYI